MGRRINKGIVFVGVALILLSCTNKSQIASIEDPIIPIDTLQTILGNNWNMLVNEADSNLFYSKNKQLHFVNNYAFFSNQRLGGLAIKGDSIYLRDTTYLSSLNPELDMKLEVRTYLIGSIEKITTDSLIIRRVKGRGFPFSYIERFVFYNDLLLYDSSFYLNRIVYSTSTCYGSCPAMAIEISSDKSFKFFGGEYADYQGNFIGTVDTDYLKRIENELRFTNIKQETYHYHIPADTPNSEMIIYYNDSMKTIVSGYSRYYPPRIQKIASLVYNSYKYAKMDSVQDSLDFETTAHNVDLDMLLTVEPPPRLEDK